MTDEEIEGSIAPARVTLAAGDWSVNPATGMIALTDQALDQMINPEPIENCYSLDPEPIARGQFAVVYHCHHLQTGEEYAAKVSSRWRHGSDSTPCLVHEIAVCAMLRPNENTVQLIDVFRTDSEVVLIMEYAPGGDLQTVLDEKRYPYERDVIGFMRQLLESLVFIHDRNIVHLDIKPPNLVLMGEFPDCDVKLCDFEISRMLTAGHEVREILGTPDYVAPEVIHYDPITTRTDMWSVGVLTYVMLTSYLPFGGESDQETYLEISRCELDFPPQLFEDITPEAIDFISKLLIRQPEQRMTARESLKHVWMRSDVRRPTPPSTLNLCPYLLTEEIQPPNPAVQSDQSISQNDPSLPSSRKSSYDSIDSYDSEGGHRINLVLHDLSKSFKDIGRPPLHPSSSQKSIYGDQTPVVGTPVTTPGSLLVSPFIYRLEQQQQQRLAPKHNLERLKSLSKSREVLSEKIQLSNLKKSQSKSREKLCEARLGLSKSREQLMALKSFSQSIEAGLSVSRLNQQASGLYQSCNNIFVPKVQQLNEAETQGRMYQSMAGIDLIDNINYSNKMGYFESRVSMKSNELNDMHCHNTPDSQCSAKNTDNSSNSRCGGGLRVNPCKGGRGETSERKCSRSQRQPEAQLTQRIRNSRAEKMKKDTEKRRKERKEKQEKEKEKKRHSLSEIEMQGNRSEKLSGSHSPTFRRGSVSNVEQRLQERHERNQERLERQEKEERRHRSKRHGSVDLERLTFTDRQTPTKSNSSSTTRQRPRSVTPTRRRKSKKEAPTMSDVSEASSLESFDEQTETTTTRPENQILTIPHLKITPDEPNEDTDEAYVSLEESTSRDIYLMRLKSVESDDSASTEFRIKEEEGNNQGTEVPPLSVSEKIQNFEKVLISMHNNKANSGRRIGGEFLNPNPPSLDLDDASSTHSSDLSIITEEDDSTDLLRIDPIFSRSISNTSDLCSTISETSEGSQDMKDTIDQITETDSTEPQIKEWKSRTRSLSIHAKGSYTSKPYSRSRSNSCHFEPCTGSGSARPWGNVCSGSFARAFEKFNTKTDDLSSSSPATCQSQTRRQSSPILSPTRESISLLH